MTKTRLNDRITENAEADRMIAETAESEAIAQVGLIRTLKPLDRAGRKRVLQALDCILTADRYVPGIFETFRDALAAQSGKKGPLGKEPQGSVSNNCDI